VLPDGSSRLVYTRGADGFLMEILITSAGVWGAPAVKVSSASFNTSLSVLPDGSSRLVYTRGADGFLMEVLTTDAYSAIPIKDDYAFVGSGIVEVGQNSNGTYIKFGDGTMEEWGESSTVTTNQGPQAGWYYSLSSTVTFPLPFTSVPKIFCTANRKTNANYNSVYMRDAPTISTFAFEICSPGNTQTVSTFWHAMGRWK
jgi:hypothetical protein